MAFFPDVKIGDKFKPSVALSNSVRHMVNGIDGFRAGSVEAVTQDIVKIGVYNASDSVIEIGKPVQFGSGTIINDCLPILPLTESTQNFGVLQDNLPKNAFGDCVVFGATSVAISGGTGSYAVPVANGFQHASEGTRILYEANGVAVILLGSIYTPSSGPVPTAGYAGPFCVTLSGGTASVKNGADPESQYAGEVIIGTTHYNMPTGTLAAGTGTIIYLTVYYSTALPGLVYAFNTSLSTGVLGAQGWYCELARVTAAGLIQTHWGGNIEISGRWM